MISFIHLFEFCKCFLHDSDMCTSIVFFSSFNEWTTIRYSCEMSIFEQANLDTIEGCAVSALSSTLFLTCVMSALIFQYIRMFLLAFTHNYLCCGVCIMNSVPTCLLSELHRFCFHRFRYVDK